MRENKILAPFIKYVSLNILGMIGLSCYILADTFFISNALGADGLTALNLAISVYSILHASGLMLGIGGATQYAIFRSQHRDHEAAETFTRTVIFCLLFSLLFFFTGIFFTRPLAQLLGANQDTLQMTVTYLRTILCFAPFFMLNNTLLAFVRNDKNPKLSMTAMLIGSFANIILDYIFIFPLSMGMFGAALATGIAPIISMGLLSLHFLKKHHGLHLSRCSITFAPIKRILSLGLSSFITEVASGIVLIVFNLLILRLSGNHGVAAYGIVANVALVATSIFTGIAQGIQPLASKACGSHDHVLIAKLIRYTLVLSLFAAAFLYSMVFLFTDQIIAAFNRDQLASLEEIAGKGFILYFSGFFFAGINITMSALFSAIARPWSAFAISISRGCIAILPMAALLSLMFGMNGVWLSFPGAELLTFSITCFLLIRYLRSPDSRQ